MEGLDIIIVTFNSEQWIEKCLDSICDSNFDLGKIHITFVDNNSHDQSARIVEEYGRRNLFGGYQLIELEENKGFGYANNAGIEQSQQPYVFFLNIDTELPKNILTVLNDIVDKSSEDTAMWELRQFPFEHPKFYDPITFETSWASAAACIVRRNAFETAGKFDEKIFMYAEDVDISWRLRAKGYKIKYVPQCYVYHYSYQKAGEIKPNQYFHSIYNNLMLRYKYGTWKDIFIGYLFYLFEIIRERPYLMAQQNKLKANFWFSFLNGWKYRSWKRENGSLGFKPTFTGFDYEISRTGAFYKNVIPKYSPLVSIIVRTCGRPAVLREALCSIRNQTYKNLEVVIVEDGLDISREMIEKDFGDLKVIYHATNEKVGRGRAANIALGLSNGEFINFLDDDDLFFADHVEVLISALLRKNDYSAAYSLAFESMINVKSTGPFYDYRVIFYDIVYNQKFSLSSLFERNYFPIQSVMFSRNLYENLGGIDESFEVLEDWDLWLKYAIFNNFIFVEKVTSIYRVPSSIEKYNQRKQLLEEYEEKLHGKYLDTKIKLKLSGFLERNDQAPEKYSSVLNKLKSYSKKRVLFMIKRKLIQKVKITRRDQKGGM